MFKPKVNKNFVEKVIFEYDDATQQYSVVNDMTPGIYGVGETKKEALEEYLSAMKDFLLVTHGITHESKAIA